jgi:predicted exporter
MVGRALFVGVADEKETLLDGAPVDAEADGGQAAEVGQVVIADVEVGDRSPSMERKSFRRLAMGRLKLTCR